MTGRTSRSDNNYGLCTPDNLYSWNLHLLGSIMQVMQNGDSNPLAPGDVVIGSGGGVSTSAGYRVNGTIGQDLSSQPKSSIASYAASSGYWYTNIASYLPVVVSD